MKGPRSRHKFYIARTWECAACKKRVLTDVRTVNRVCSCQGNAGPTWMTLIDDPPRAAKKPPAPPEQASDAPVGESRIAATD